MTDLVQSDEHETPLTEEEARELIPSLSTRAELNLAERTNILKARRCLRRADEGDVAPLLRFARG